MPPRKLIFRIHAIRRMFQRRIDERDVKRVLTDGEVIEEYPGEAPYPSRLILGWCASRPIHVVVADNAESNETIVITVYEPHLSKWDESFKRRRGK